jgi:hypothetical protein
MQKGCEFEASLSYIARPYSKKTTSVVEQLPRVCKVLGFVPSPINKKAPHSIYIFVKFISTPPRSPSA